MHNSHTARNMPNMPTRIIEKPLRAAKPTGHGNHRVQLYCRCDDGHIYTLEQLAEMIGLVYHTMCQRLRNYGWDSDKLLMPPCQRGMKHRPGGKIISPGNSEWKRLGCRPRNRNLNRFPAPGIFER